MKTSSHFPQFSYKNKLILVFSLIILFGTITMGFFSYYETSYTIREDIEKYSSKILKEVNLNLARYFNEYEQIFYNIATNDEFMRWLVARKEDEYNASLSYLNIYDYCIKPVKAIRPEIMTINLLNDNGNEKPYHLQSDYFYKEDYSLKNEPWISQIYQNNKTFIVVCKNNNYRKAGSEMPELLTIILVRKFKMGENASGYIQIDVSLKPAMEILNEMKFSDGGESMILSESGVIMAHTDTSKVSEVFDADIFKHRIKDLEHGYFIDKKNDRVIAFSTISNIGWKSVAIIPYGEQARGIYRIGTATLIIAGFSLSLSIFLVVSVSLSLTKRIRKMIKIIKQTQMGNIYVRVDIPGSDEISRLAAAYNTMLDAMEKNINELAETRLLQQEAVLSALQAQINSHFLYNTLEMINSMAFIVGHKDIQNAVVSLSNMLRYTSNYRDYLVTIKEEIGHLEDYLSIMKAQMDENLNYEIIMEDNMEDVLCLKAIIQPVVENSIKHGLELIDRPGHIKIAVNYSGDSHICISITDNGRGFDENKRNEIERCLYDADNHVSLKEISRVGLVNVNYRLRVFYHGRKAGLRVENLWKRSGAKVKIMFPLERKGAVQDV